VKRRFRAESSGSGTGLADDRPVRGQKGLRIQTKLLSHSGQKLDNIKRRKPYKTKRQAAGKDRANQQDGNLFPDCGLGSRGFESRHSPMILKDLLQISSLGFLARLRGVAGLVFAEGSDLAVPTASM
jgi:hypothetical protein